MNRLSPDVLCAIDEVCDGFEAALSSDMRPSIRACLESWTGEGAGELFRSLFSLEVDYRLRSGERIDSEACTSQYPEYAVQVAEVLNEARSRQAAPQVQAGQTRIGAFTLMEKLGEGGMGAVWLASQEFPVRRKVALKIIRSGLADREVLARFAAERQALAMMEHPNIARILDAGETENGQPWFAMELVQGLPLNAFSDQHRLSINDRLRLFMDVCSGVQHAHQKGIIHRDLKPSNILVSEAESGSPGIPKVIDFGLAKAFAGASGGQMQTVHTEYGQVLGTVKYMSPEQAGLNAVDVDTRADIYSLGIILYELLTGTTPFDGSGDKSLFQMLEEIRTREPVRPSSQLSTQRNQLATIFEMRQIDPHHLGRELKGDLDWIVMKALDKERHRRYQTAADFSADIQRYLDKLPVQARPPSTSYLIRRFVRRNRGAVAAAGAILATLVAGLGFSVAMYVRERDARAKSEQAATRSDQVAEFLGDMLRAAGPSKARGRDSAMLQDILDTTAERLGKELGDFPEVEAELRSVIGGTYEDLENFEKGTEMHRIALRLRRSFLPEGHIKVIQSMYDLASVLEYQDQLEESEALLRQCLAALQTPSAENLKLAFQINNVLSWVRFRQGDLRDAEGYCRHSLVIAKEMGEKGEDEASTSLSTLGTILEKKSLFSESVTVQREAIELTRKSEGELHPGVVVCLNNLCHSLVKEGKFSEVLTTAREALDLEVRIYGKPVSGCTDALHKAIANVHEYRGEYSEAIRHIETAIAAATDVYGADHRYTNDKRALMIRVQVKAGLLDEADATLKKAESVGADQSADTSLLAAQALLKLARNDIPSAEKLAEADIERARAESREQTVGLAEALRVRALVRLAQNRLDDAEKELRTSIEILRPDLNPNSPLVAEAWSDLAKVLRARDASSSEAAGLEQKVQALRETAWQ
jgi:eukaryotic-like serine/threonine-protein kinase